MDYFFDHEMRYVYTGKGLCVMSWRRSIYHSNLVHMFVIHTSLADAHPVALDRSGGSKIMCHSMTKRFLGEQPLEAGNEALRCTWR